MRHAPQPTALLLAGLALLSSGGCAQPPHQPPAAALPPAVEAARPPPPAASPGPVRRTAARMPRTPDEPLGLPPPPPPAPPLRADEFAPVPDRNIEAPRDRFAEGDAARLEPMLLPPERRTGMTFGREHLRETGPDRPFDMIVPGARLRIPFESSGSR